jgi:hypothetical protein
VKLLMLMMDHFDDGNIKDLIVGRPPHITNLISYRDKPDQPE